MTSNWRSITGAILLMLAGGALALASEHLLILHMHQHGGHHDAAMDVPSSDAILSKLDDVLKLTPAQHDSIAHVLKRHHAAIDSAWKAIHMQLGTSMDSVHKEIGRILTKEQSDQFLKWLRGQGVHHVPLH